MKKVLPVQPGQVGLSISEFVRRCGFSRSAFYALPESQKPKFVRIGKEGSRRSAIVIIESPVEFLQRLAAMQEAV